MLQSLIETLPWVVGLLGLFSFLTVHAWSSQRRREREALYRNEAIKRMAEMPGASPERVAELLRESIAATRDQPSPATMGPLQARAYYQNQTLQKIAEAGSGGEAVISFLREEQKLHARRTREGLKLGGTICMAVSIALAIVLRVTVTGQAVYLVALIPGAVGAILFTYSFFIASND